MTSILCNSGAADGMIASSGTSSGGGVSGQKRNATPPQPFTFAAKELSITFSAPIETMKQKNGVTTGVPKGKTNKELSYDLTPFIMGRNHDSASENDEESDNNVKSVGEEFMTMFTLSKFRKDIRA